MGFYETYKAVFQNVKSIVQGVKAIKQTVLGERFKLTTLPLAIINPTSTRLEQAVIGANILKASIGFDVILIVRETEPKDWFDDVISLMGRVFDAVLADRTLKGSVLDVYPSTFTPGEIRFTEKVYYGGLVGFEALLNYQPS